MQALSYSVTMIEWDGFRFVLALSRKRTLKAAADLLGVDQTTVGRRISALECTAPIKIGCFGELPPIKNGMNSDYVICDTPAVNSLFDMRFFASSPRQLSPPILKVSQL